MEAKLKFAKFATTVRKASRGAVVLGVAMALAIACSTAQKGADQPPPVQGPSGEVMGPPEPYGPQPVPSADPAAVYGPEPIQFRPLVLVLGPGMARAFAHAGALRALTEAKIPIGAVVGTEMGSFIGALYAMEGNVNHLDWALLRFKDDVFVPSKGLFSAMFDEKSRSGKLSAGLQKAFGARDLSQAKIPVRVAIAEQGSSEPDILSSGKAWEAVRAALSVQGIYAPTTWNGMAVIAATEARPYPVAEARALGIGPVVVIDTQLPEKAASSAALLKEADLVIRPQLKGIGEMDFSKRTEAAFRGKRAILDQLREIRHWVGLPQNDPTEDPTATTEGVSR